MKALALLGGPQEQWPDNIVQIFKQAKKDHKLILASDRGSLFLLEMGIAADVAVGDFDSLRKTELNLVKEKVADIRYSHPVKDLTDSELLFLTAFEDYRVDELEVYGATGGRLDHFLVNLFTFSKAPLVNYCRHVSLIDKQNKINYLDPGNYEFKFDADYPYFGVGNLSEVKNLKIQDARYNLKNYSSSTLQMFSSNEFVPEKNVKIFLQQGIVIFIYSKDLNRFSNL